MLDRDCLLPIRRIQKVTQITGVTRFPIISYLIKSHEGRQEDGQTHTRKTEKSSSSTTGTPPKGTPLRTVVCVALKQVLLSEKLEGEVPFLSPRIHCSHHREAITGVEPAVCLQRLICWIYLEKLLLSAEAAPKQIREIVGVHVTIIFNLSINCLVDKMSQFPRWHLQFACFAQPTVKKKEKENSTTSCNHRLD